MAVVKKIALPDGTVLDIAAGGGGGGGTNLDEEPCAVTFGSNSVTEVFTSGTKTTTFNNDGSITESWPDGVVMRTVFNADGSITRSAVTS